MQSNSTVKGWDHALECINIKWGDRCPQQISSDVPRKLVEEFLFRLRDTPNAKYSQKDIENLGFEVSKEVYEHKEREGVWEGFKSVIFIDMVTAELLEMDGQSIFRIRVVVNRHVQNAQVAIDWDKIRTRRRLSDYAWRFWLSANLRPVSEPSLRMKSVMKMGRTEPPSSHEARLQEIERLQDKVSDLTIESRSQQVTISLLQRALSDISNKISFLPRTIMGLSTAATYEDSTDDTRTLTAEEFTVDASSMQTWRNAKKRRR
jgi:hypothetical protein